jgi:L-ascorbate metabolism protein UlaG (beta-lactamase superfamily)
MEITWLGHSSFRLRGREGTVVTDPTPRKVSGSSRLTANIVTVSHPHPGHSAIATVGGAPRVISGPGEYEVAGIEIVGVPTYHDAERGKKRGKNTAYVIELDDLVVCHLGDLGHIPTTEQLGQMRKVDVLLVPVGGDVTIDAAQAVEVISLIEPKIVIPMHFRTGEGESRLEPVDRFLRDMGVTGAEPQPKLSVTASNLPEGTQVVLLESRGAAAV